MTHKLNQSSQRTFTRMESNGKKDYIPIEDNSKVKYKNKNIFSMARLFSWGLLFTFCLLGLTVLIVTASQNKHSMSQFFVKDDYKSERLSAEKLNSLKGLFYVREGTDDGSIRILADKGEKLISRDQLPQNTRVIPHGSMVTMDFVEDRLNVHLDQSNHISKAKYG